MNITAIAALLRAASTLLLACNCLRLKAGKVIWCDPIAGTYCRARRANREGFSCHCCTLRMVRPADMFSHCLLRFCDMVMRPVASACHAGLRPSGSCALWVNPTYGVFSQVSWYRQPMMHLVNVNDYQLHVNVRLVSGQPWRGTRLFLASARRITPFGLIRPTGWMFMWSGGWRHAIRRIAPCGLIRPAFLARVSAGCPGALTP